MRVLCCGDRWWHDGAKVRERLSRLPAGTTIIHGDCTRRDPATRELISADYLAGQAARALGLPVEAYPADWSVGRAAGPIRNQKMLDSGVDLVIAFHSDITRSRGTADMVRRARKANIPVEVIE